MNHFLNVYLCLIRWQSPVPITKWDPKIINATRPPPACPQPPVPQSRSMIKSTTLPDVSL
jgi:carboxylesterase type B